MVKNIYCTLGKDKKKYYFDLKTGKRIEKPKPNGTIKCNPTKKKQKKKIKKPIKTAPEKSIAKKTKKSSKKVPKSTKKTPVRTPPTGLTPPLTRKAKQDKPTVLKKKVSLGKALSPHIGIDLWRIEFSDPKTKTIIPDQYFGFFTNATQIEQMIHKYKTYLKENNLKDKEGEGLIGVLSQSDQNEFRNIYDKLRGTGFLTEEELKNFSTMVSKGIKSKEDILFLSKGSQSSPVRQKSKVKPKSLSPISPLKRKIENYLWRVAYYTSGEKTFLVPYAYLTMIDYDAEDYLTYPLKDYKEYLAKNKLKDYGYEGLIEIKSKAIQDRFIEMFQHIVSKPKAISIPTILNYREAFNRGVKSKAIVFLYIGQKYEKPKVNINDLLI